MTNSQAGRRSLTKRPLTVLGLFLAIGISVTYYFRDSPEIARARPVQLGMTWDEVWTIMGPSYSYRDMDGAGITVGKTTLWRTKIALQANSWAGTSIMRHPSPDEWPVHIHFSRREKLVDRIKPGSEIVGEYSQDVAVRRWVGVR